MYNSIMKLLGRINGTIVVSLGGATYCTFAEIIMRENTKPYTNCINNNSITLFVQNKNNNSMNNTQKYPKVPWTKEKHQDDEGIGHTDDNIDYSYEEQTTHNKQMMVNVQWRKAPISNLTDTKSALIMIKTMKTKSWIRIEVNKWLLTRRFRAGKINPFWRIGNWRQAWRINSIFADINSRNSSRSSKWFGMYTLETSRRRSTGSPWYRKILGAFIWLLNGRDGGI